jgi:hypothetical protein
MALRFSGTFEELKAQLGLLAGYGSWAEVNPNQHQFRHKNGGVLNWYPSTGAINFQGHPNGRDSLQKEVTALLQGEGVAISTPVVVDETPVQIVETAVTEKIHPISASSSHLRNYPDSEIVIGLVGAVGTEMDVIITLLKDHLTIAGYDATEIRVSRDIIPKIVNVDVAGISEAARISKLMDAGDVARN